MPSAWRTQLKRGKGNNRSAKLNPAANQSDPKISHCVLQTGGKRVQRTRWRPSDAAAGGRYFPWVQQQDRQCFSSQTYIRLLWSDGLLALGAAGRRRLEVAAVSKNNTHTHQLLARLGGGLCPHAPPLPPPPFSPPAGSEGAVSMWCLPVALVLQGGSRPAARPSPECRSCRLDAITT